MANLSLIKQLGGGTCLVTLKGAGGEVPFDVRYNNIPEEAYLTLLGVSTIGVALTELGRGVSEEGLTDEQRIDRVAALNPKLAAVREKMRALPIILSSIVDWQDVNDDVKDEKGEIVGKVNIKPTEAFFLSLPLEMRVQYASALVSAKQRPTMSSQSSLESGSTPKENTDTADSNISLSSPQTASTVQSSS
jgi:hypothetical protein